MKHFFIFILMIGLFSCSGNQSQSTNAAENRALPVLEETHVPAFQTILDAADVSGSILIFDPAQSRYYSNDFTWARTGCLPASTYKIVNSIIALETGVVKDESTFFPWDGKKRRLAMWERDFNFKEAFQFSCLPCYQEIARAIGATRMNEYLEKLNYGNMVLDSSDVDVFWVEGESKINQFEQIDFLKRLHENELPISKRTKGIVENIMHMEENNAYTLRGKTGWSIRDGNNKGWFVGFVEKEEQVYYFATNIEPHVDFNMDLFPIIRTEVTGKALTELGITAE